VYRNTTNSEGIAHVMPQHNHMILKEIKKKQTYISVTIKQQLIGIIKITKLQKRLKQTKTPY
jgi:hypothetical protein